VGEYCRQMKGMTNSLRDLGEPIAGHILVLNLLHGLSPRYGHLKAFIKRIVPFPTFHAVPNELLLEGPADHIYAARSTCSISARSTWRSICTLSVSGSPPVTFGFLASPPSCSSPTSSPRGCRRVSSPTSDPVSTSVQDRDCGGGGGVLGVRGLSLCNYLHTLSVMGLAHIALPTQLGLGFHSPTVLFIMSTFFVDLIC
jgi:hypothetical protein